MEALLAPLEAELVAVKDGAEAIAAVRDTAFDLVLMDVRMPGVDGLAATRRIRRLARGTGVPIIALSASGSPEDEAACLAAGADAYLSKPIDSARFYGLVEKFTRRAVQTDMQVVRNG